MNIHPLFVHFPIGLLAVYSLLELGAYAVPCVRRQAWAFPVKAFLLFTGVLAAFVALGTGGMAEELVEGLVPNGFILEVHASFAAATTFVYLVLAAAYLTRICDQKGWSDRIFGANRFLLRILGLRRYFTHLVLDTWLLPVLALVALVGMTITGALGAAIVYGPDADPIVSLVYHFFWAQ
ncbi:MAG: DUF2231 domain-containing protein [Candidatus Paceibacterota bacterium]|jgi:uncharacterized membrane protein